MRLTMKERIGGGVRKLYDEPKMPYRRVLESSWVSDGNKERLRWIYDSFLNSAELKREIESLQKQLSGMAMRNNDYSPTQRDLLSNKRI